MNVFDKNQNIINHIYDYCQQIDMTVKHFGDDFEIFDNNRIYQNAISLCILQIGELVGLLSEEYKTTNSQIPWKQIKQMRNIVAHRYGTVDNTITWDVIQNDIPKLREFCENK